MSDYFVLDILAFRNHKLEQLANPTSYHDSSNGIFSAWIKSTQDKYIGFELELWH